MEKRFESKPERGVFANRTMNLRSVSVVGYDMDYTLIHYRPDEWERAAFDHALAALAAAKIPVDGFRFDPNEFTIGLAFDLKLGNVVKATRFGRVVRAQHGGRVLNFEQQRRAYSSAIIELSSPRFRFMNTLFELSRASLFTQLVEAHDQSPIAGVGGYSDIYDAIDDALGVAHTSGGLKAEIVADKKRFVDLDPEVVGTLQDQQAAGKKLVLITNSDWAYTAEMMPYAFDQFMASGQSWRDLFDVVIVSANKPRFFTNTDPIYRVVDEDRSLLLPHEGRLEQGSVYFGGNARLVEKSFSVGGDEALYVGDHLFGDVHVSKDVLRWRTTLVARGLEQEITAAAGFSTEQERLEEMMSAKILVDRKQAALRLQRCYADNAELKAQYDRTTSDAVKLDDEIAPLAEAAGQLGNRTWGPLMRAGNDKSLYARQVERYADVYTSRVSNLRAETPYGYLRAARGSLPHDARFNQ